MGDKTLIGKFLVWRAKNINDRYFIIILSALIGFLAGMAAYLLKTSVFYIHDTLTEWFTKSEQNYLFVIYPGIGILLTVVFLKYIVRDETRHGIPRILYVISKLGGKMKQHKVFSSLVGSSLTAGFGGSMDVVMEKFNRTGHYNLVVLNKGRYVGFVSRANVFNAYRQTLIDVSQE